MPLEANAVVTTDKASAMNEPHLLDVSQGPARPERLTVEFYEEPDTVVVHKRRGGGPWAFLLLWLLGWTVGCVLLLVQILKEPSLGMFAFAVPFWASWLLVAGLLVWMLFGKETLFLDRDEAIFRRTAFIRLSEIIVPRKEVQGFRECRSNHSENDKYLWGIEMVTLGKPVRFAFRLPDRERAWLIHQLNRFLEASGPDAPRQFLRPPPTIARNASSHESSFSKRAPVAPELLTFESTLAEPPTDCSWHLTEDSDAFALGQKGRLNIAALAILLFLNAFWNGIVSVFVMVLFGLMPINNAPQGWQWWGLFVFLIPFEAIGLVIFGALGFVVLEPWRRTAWRFDWDRIVRQTRWPVYCYTRAWQVLHLDRLELRRRRGSNSSAPTDLTGEMPFELAFVTSDNVDLCDIRKLTEGEARWLARIVLERRRNWFSK
jgi:hypothetical protein